jgi:hypothetical protein
LGGGGGWLGQSLLRQGIDDFIAAYNPQAHPFEWRKVKVHAKTLSGKYSNLIK